MRDNWWDDNGVDAHPLREGQLRYASSTLKEMSDDPIIHKDEPIIIVGFVSSYKSPTRYGLCKFLTKNGPQMWSYKYIRANTHE